MEILVIVGVGALGKYVIEEAMDKMEDGSSYSRTICWLCSESY